MTTLIESRPPQMGQDHGYCLSPQPKPGCEVIWKINGQPVSVGDEIGGLKVKIMGGYGPMSVEVVGDTIRTTVSATIDCGGGVSPEDVDQTFI